jgi:hypothetical protein
MALGLSAFAVACVEPTPQGPEVLDVQLAQGGSGGPGPKVQSTDPSNSPPGVTLDVRVLGRGFENGATVTFLRNLVVTGEIVTNSTTYVSDRELVANVTIQSDATEDLYDVQVANRNKDGLGIELFAVVYNPSDGTPGSLTLADGSPGIYFPGGATYTDNVNGDQVELGGADVKFNLQLDNNVQDPSMLFLDFSTQTRAGGCAPADCTAGQLELDSPVEKSPPGWITAIDDSGADLPLLDMLVDPGDGSQTKEARLRVCFNHPYPGLRKDPRYCVRYQFPTVSDSDPINAIIEAESDYLEITRTAADTWVVTDGAAGASAVLMSKVKDKGPEVILDEGTYHMPVHITITCVIATLP